MFPLTRSSLPSPFRSATAARPERLELLIGEAKVPSPLPGKTSTVTWPPVTRSGMPSPVKSPTTTAGGDGPVSRDPDQEGAPSVPSPLPSRTLTVS